MSGHVDSAGVGVSSGADGGAVGALLRGWRGLVWFLRAFTGEDRWEAHVRECAAHGHSPGSRRDFERRRADAAAATPVQRCC